MARNSYIYSVQCPRPFPRDKIVKFCTRVLCAPAEPFTCFLFYPRQKLVFFCIFWGESLGLKGSHISDENKKEKYTYSLTVPQGHIKHVCKFFRVSYLSKTASALGPLCGKRAKITASHRNYLFSVYIRFWALNMTFNIGPAQPIFETCLGAPGSGSFTKKNRKKMGSSYGNAYCWPL